MADHNLHGGVRLSPLMALRLAAPQTWVASLLPAALGAVLAFRAVGGLDVPMLLCLVGICLLMQSAVNTFNDYCDFIKGTDTPESCPDAADAVIVHENPSLHSVLALGIAFLTAAALLGILPVLRCGWRPLAVGCIGGIAVLLYSFGKKPLSYLPLGELVSGFVMGGLIPFAVYGVLSGHFAPVIFLYSPPVILGIALIMFTNNACDIDRDLMSGRRTFAVLVGSRETARLYRALLLVWAVLPEFCLLARGGYGALIYPPALLFSAAPLVVQLRLTPSPAVRGTAMKGISMLNITLGLAYLAALALG